MPDDVHIAPTEAEVAAEIIRGIRAEAPPTLVVTPESDLFRDLSLDSITLTSLVVSLEDHYRILLNEEDAGEVRTVGDLAALVVRRLRQQP
jgi:acyl carrier protein